MHKISFGIVGFFGILMPGALLLVNIIAPLAATFASLDWLTGTAGYRLDTLIIIVLILLSFTVGTILRTLPPRWAEWPYRKLSNWCFRDILQAYLDKPQKTLFESIPTDVWNIHYNPERTQDEDEKHWRQMRLFNFAKKFVIAQSERLAREVQTAEGLSRFMSSVFWCALAGVFISVAILTILVVTKHSPSDSKVAIYFGVANLVLFAGSARGIGPIREHEGEVVMQSFFCLQSRQQPSPGGSKGELLSGGTTELEA